jgi:hypothetical protein
VAFHSLVFQQQAASEAQQEVVSEFVGFIYFMTNCVVEGLVQDHWLSFLAQVVV